VVLLPAASLLTRGDDATPAIAAHATAATMSTESPGPSEMTAVETLEFVLECSVCLEPLTTSHKVLPCQHTFCLQCLRDLYAKKKAPEMLCPECRTPCSVQLQNLPCNVILNRILEAGMSVKKSEKFQQQPQQTKIIAGNPSTNPFLDLAAANSVSAASSSSIAPPLSKSFMNLSLLSGGGSSTEASSPISPAMRPPSLPPKPGLLTPAAAPNLPPPPPPPAPTASGTTTPNSGGATPTHSAASSRGQLQPVPGSTSVGHQIYRALYDYNPIKSDELSLRKGELYIVIEKCKDGWYKGSSVASLKTGVFPGNYVQHIKQEEEEKRRRRKEDSDKTIDQIIDLDDTFGVRKGVLAPPPNVDLARQAAQPQQRPALPSSSVPRPPVPPPPSSVPAAARERYRCTVSYPASSEYELELRHGDVVVLLRRRDDGWCKGRLERTGQTGLFPSSFVQKI